MTIPCPDCGKDAATSGRVLCLCDKDFCNGQRCGASDLTAHYKCASCGSEGATPEAARYESRYIDR
ncbi:hypothetical protein D3C71_2133430 [compost metagenome]